MIEELTNNIFVQKILIVVLITLLPLVPAFILFKFLPSKSIVSGPFKGLNVDFSGATAIYFIIFITIFGASQFWELGNPKNLDLDKNDVEVWKVEGRLNAENLTEYDKEDFRLTVQPQIFGVEPDGKFTVYVLRKRDPTTGVMEFPRLWINDRDGHYMGRPIDLDIDTTEGIGGVEYTIERIDSINTLAIQDSINIFLNDLGN